MATLIDEVRLNGQLGFGEIVEFPRLNGILTALPVAGSEVQHGEQVYEVDGVPVVLFQGTRPFWRELNLGAMPGEDVRQLETNLAALGFYTGTPDTYFDSQTELALRAWQQSLGAPVTGVFSPNAVIVAASDSVRIHQVAARLGDTGVTPGTFSETELRATIPLTFAQARDLTAGTPVIVAIPGGVDISTEISAVDPGGLPTGLGGLTSGAATIYFVGGDQAAVAAVGAVGVRVTVVDDSDQPPTLVVPAVALIAPPGGGYAVEIWDGATIRRVPVEIGLVADARVQITGGDLRAGDEVVLAR
ncbi:MAG: peptidoglycan-binding protein [Cellulomonadaceae bacterium]|nr:peptidoglycan-binding protein [Cellulomonadaceae bacterium]